MFCSNCGAQLGVGNFCPACGAARNNQPVVAPQTAQPAQPAWGSAGVGTTDYSSAYRTPLVEVSPRAKIFENLGKLSAGLMGLGFVLMLLNPLVFPGSELSQVFSFNSFALLILTAATVFSVLLHAPTWGRWVVVLTLSLVYWLIVRPLVAFVGSEGAGFDFSEYPFTSPLQLFFDSFQYLDVYLNVGGFLWVAVYLGSLVVLQLAPTIATIAMLGAAITNKRLS